MNDKNKYIVLGEETFDDSEKPVKRYRRVLVETDSLKKTVAEMHIQGLRIADIYKKIDWQVIEK